jgi:outer membrane protein OmpA-like peptidoglycan-associated protein
VYKLLVFLLLLCYTVTGFSQKSKSASDHIKAAETDINQANYKAAKQELEAAIGHYDNQCISHRLLGLVYMKLHDFKNSIKEYKKAIELQPNYSKAMHYECGMAHAYNEQYEEAENYFNYYQQSDSKNFKYDERSVLLAYDERVQQEIENCHFAKANPNDGSYEKPKAAWDGINTEYDEYQASIRYDAKEILFTRTTQSEDIYLAKATGKTSNDVFELKTLNTELNEGMARFSACGDKIWLAACNRENGKGGCDLFQAAADENKNWQLQETDITTQLNTKDWDSQPAFTCDGNTMYFASNRTGGLGGTDIWVSCKGENGKWSAPKNMGEAVNTPFDEESPWVANDGITFYFSSNGHPGFGDADIYVSYKDSVGDFTRAKNLGRSINTPYRETGFSILPSETDALFSSDRPGGKGGLDIYIVGVPRDLSPKIYYTLVKGSVWGIDNKPLPAKVKIKKSGKDVMQIIADEKGLFSLCLSIDNAYSFVVAYPGYENFIEAFIPVRNAEKIYEEVNLVLDKKGYSSPQTEEPIHQNTPNETKKGLSVGTSNVFFESSSFEMPEEEKTKIKKLIDQFARIQDISINLIGFADEVGSVEKNRFLSERRATTVSYYLQYLGVPENHIKIEAKGEDKMYKEDTEKHFKRRVEVYIKQ